MSDGTTRNDSPVEALLRRMAEASQGAGVKPTDAFHDAAEIEWNVGLGGVGRATATAPDAEALWHAYEERHGPLGTLHGVIDDGNLEDMTLDAYLADLGAAVERLRSAIEKHRRDLWGEGAAVLHEVDTELYAALASSPAAEQGGREAERAAAGDCSSSHVGRESIRKFERQQAGEVLPAASVAALTGAGEGEG